MRKVTTFGLAISCGLTCTAYARQGQQRPAPGRRTEVQRDSGRLSHSGDGPRVVYSTTVSAPNASWLRVALGEVLLTGDTETERASYVLLTSLTDGATQRLNAEQVRQWGRMSAYFNGDAVRVEVVAFPGPGENRLVVDSVIAGAERGGNTDSLCGSSDDRVLSSDSRVARILTGGGVCTGFIISDSSRCMLSAGQCAPGAGSVVEFNVPLSSSTGVMTHPGPENQYAVDVSSIQSAGGPGNDWAYFGVYANSNTGLGAAAAQGVAFPIASAPVPASQTLWITGFGVVSAPIVAAWNQVQKAGTGPYVGLAGTVLRHQVDTTAGDNGAPITLAGQAIGINNGDGCVDPVGGSFNVGTAMQSAGLQAALAAPAGLCAHGDGPPEPPIYLATDSAHNLVTMSRSSGAFGVVGTTGIAGQVNGLAYDRGRGRFYATEFVNGGPDLLYTINKDTGVATLVGPVNGPPDVSGLGFDPNTDTLYGIDESSGQLYHIDFNTGAAAAVGSPSGPGVGGIDFDPSGNVLYGVDDSAPTGTRLVKINTATGARTVVGTLGSGITDCDGLAYSPDETLLYTVDQTTGQALQVNPATGAATPIGPAGAINGNGYGMASSYECAPPCVANSPIPGDGDQQLPITTNITWLGCPNQKAFAVDSNPALGINLLYDVMTATGGATVIGPTSPGSQQISGMAWAGFAMYAIDLTTGNLMTINTLTGVPTVAGSTGLTGWQDLASDATDNGQLYGITQTNKLYRIWFDGTPTLVATNVGTLITATAFDRVGQLWGIEFSTGRVLKINKSTGAITPMATTIAGFQAMDFDDAGTAYAHNSSTDSLYAVNLLTGMATLRGPSGTDTVKSLAFGRSTFLINPPPGGDVGNRNPRRPLFDPTNLTETTPVSVNPDLIIDESHHGLPPGFVAVGGREYPAVAAPATPPAPPPSFGPAVHCGGTIISFDDMPAPCTFGLATRLTHQYASRGVVFEGPAGSDGGAVLNQCANLGITGVSGTNCLTFDPGSVLADGGLPRGPQTILFPIQVSSVQISVASATAGMVTMQAYRGATLVASRSAPLTTAMTPMAVSASGITRVVITGSGPFAADDLCFVQSCPTTYDVYLDKHNPPTTLRGSAVVSTVFDPGSLDSSTVYYWKIVAHNCCGQIESPVWRFTTICYPNCDGSTIDPFLNVLDFMCFINRFTAGDPWANCDDSTIPPVLNVLDFTCFLNKFAAGCPQ